MNAFLDLSNCALKGIKHIAGERDLTLSVAGISTFRGTDQPTLPSAYC